MKQTILLLLLVYAQAFSWAQTAMTLDEAEKTFLEKNLFLLAAQYNINVKEALIIQSKAYPNPVFSADLNVYDPDNDKFFHVNNTGQKVFQVEQLIVLGGKRKTEINMAKQNKILAEAEFADLLRNLKAQLHNYYFSINSEKIMIDNYQKQLEILDTIISAYKIQVDKGNFPMKDAIRLKSVYIKLNSNKSELAAQYNDNQKQMQLLLQSKQEILPVVNDNDFEKFIDLKSLNDLQNLAATNRPDLKMADESAILAAMNLKLQKRQAIPDIALNANYDQRGGAFNNQINAGISMPLPVFNANRGNVRAAEFDKKAMDLYAQEKKLEVELDVQQAWLNMQRSINEYNKVKELYNEDFEKVNTGMKQNFHLRNISILEFVDFVESFNESLSDFEEIKKQLAQSAAKINYVTATKIY
ncbi:MAG: TolC family protein [Bacteroidetes bacterium]|nr:TolC family protein [Bacteroidota bacterium]